MKFLYFKNIFELEQDGLEEDDLQESHQKLNYPIFHQGLAIFYLSYQAYIQAHLICDFLISMLHSI